MSNKSRHALILVLGIAACALVLAACGGAAAPAATSAPAATGGWQPDPTLLAAAKKEGGLTTIALPHDWCDYGDMLSGFTAKTGIPINELNPQGSSAAEIKAIEDNKDNPGPQAPDVVDVGEGHGPEMVSKGIVAPYKVSTWDTIPDTAKDPDGNWWGDYYGVESFLVNTDVQSKVPADWNDLLDPAYKGQVSMTGDPRISNQAMMTVYAAALANGGSLDNLQPGLDFWAKVNKNSNFVPVIGTNAMLAKGETPVQVTWDYLGLSAIDSFKGNPKATVVVPKSGVIGGIYIQAISKYAPHPNAAKLWMEWEYSDEGQLIWLKGYCHPIRFNDLAKRNVIPADLLTKLPPAAAYASTVFPTLDQQAAATKFVTDNWDKVVGANVK